MTAYDEQILASVRAHLERLERRIQRMEQQDHFIPAVYVGRTDGSGVSAMSGSTPGTGTVTLYEFDAAGDLAAIVDSNSNNVTETVYNLSQTAVAANTYVQLKQEVASGNLLVDYEDCG